MKVMKPVHVSDLTAGCVLAQPISGKNGMVMLKTGTILTERYIKRLKNLNIMEIVIEEPRFAETYTAATVRTSQTAFHDQAPVVFDTITAQQKTQLYSTLTQLPDDYKFLQRSAIPLFDEKFKKIYRKIIQELLQKDFIMDEITKLFVKDTYLFKHTLNVTIISGLMGLAKNYSYNQLMELTIGALLFDIGMVYLPDSLIKKSEIVTEAEKRQIQEHTLNGYQLLNNHKEIPKPSAYCALQHHERFNGSGYPHCSAGIEIHEYAQIIAIADVYDALISPRYHRMPHSPNEAAEYLLASGNYFFDVDLIRFFFQTIAIYPVASRVLLSTGQIGIVNYISSGIGHRPIVRIIVEADGKPAAWPYEVDLGKETKLVITNSL